MFTEKPHSSIHSSLGGDCRRSSIGMFRQQHDGEGWGEERKRMRKTSVVLNTIWSIIVTSICWRALVNHTDRPIRSHSHRSAIILQFMEKWKACICPNDDLWSWINSLLLLLIMIIIIIFIHIYTYTHIYM